MQPSPCLDLGSFPKAAPEPELGDIKPSVLREPGESVASSPTPVAGAQQEGPKGGICFNQAQQQPRRDELRGGSLPASSGAQQNLA